MAQRTEHVAPLGPTADLWSQLPPGLAAVLRPGVGDLTREIRAELDRVIPAFAKRPSGRVVTEGIQQALLWFLDRVADPGAVRDEGWPSLFRDFGLPALDTRALDVVQTAYRVGARVAWRRMARIGEEAGVPTDTLCLLAEAIFAYIDELSALSVRGHATARAAELTAQQRRRTQLLTALLTPTTSPQTLTRLADTAQWPLPESVVAVAIDPTGPDLSTVDLPNTLADLDSPHPCLLLPTDSLSPPEVADQGGSAELPTLTDRGTGPLSLADRRTGPPILLHLADHRTAIGPAVPLAAAAQSLYWARRTLSLVAEGVLPASPVTWFDHHLSTLWLRNDPPLLREMATQALAPLATLNPHQAAKLAATLLTWLHTRGGAPGVAQHLDVHPQTVRYRLRQLTRLFGTRLTDPDHRFTLEVALRARALGG
ncbi:PucR family transcriptional regulator [Actinokineospora terrae]|uniref:PucR C-terminal helix-turn-helix domain-containing protein n=1 Tax=Actinokineospora terrae TaxID=155974 RepID=A0A1H9XN37_9PSEU|nr:helix-turn-helix domain-containing protein [Actinokineospora terrae]SES47595.1 PucR C-terminal helix-turn-helix domain-containing protein [Actinokineospora terrae]